MMNIEHLKLFVRVASLSNISLAGSELGLSPAVASSHMNKLEAGLGVKLIHRTTRRVSLTQEGEAFLPHAQDVIENVEIAKASISAGSLKPQGRLRITASSSFGRMHIIPALPDFLKLYPDLTLDLKLSDNIIDMVGGGFDIAIRDAALNDSTLIARKLSDDPRIICASPAYIEKHGTPQTPQDLKEHSCICFSGLETWTFNTINGHQSIKVANQLKIDNGEAIRDACTAGIGITLMSTWCAYQQLNSGELVEILKDFPLVSETSIWAVYPSSRLIAPKVRAFIDYFVEYFDNKAPW